jgi:flagellin
MVMSVNTNVLSLTAQRNMMGTQNSLSTSIERLSTGLRINSARDDAAGLAIAERFTSSIRGSSVAQRNANDGISFAQTAEGALDVIGGNLQRIRELAVQSLNDSNTDADRTAINQEVQQLTAEVQRIASDTTFNSRNILDGSLGTMLFQIGAERGQTLDISGVDARATTLGSSANALVQQNRTTQIDYVNAPNGYDDVFVNGVGVDLSNINSESDVVSAINAVSNQTGVTASVETRVDLGALDAAGGTLTVNGTDVVIAANSSAQDVADSINAETNLGVTASLSQAGNVVITSTSGEDVALAESAAGLFGGFDNGTFVSAIRLSSSGSDPITVSGTDAVALDLTDAGAGTATAFSSGITVDQVSVATRADANNALDAMDAAIDQITAMRADLGAVQNRFENVIEVAGVQMENLSAARSRIQDADFAAETANLTRAQILQQAGLASLAQANAAPQAVLSLLG